MANDVNMSKMQKNNRWWMIIAGDSILVAILYGAILTNTILGFDVHLPNWFALAGSTIILSPIVLVTVAYHFDRKYVTSISDWKPAKMYYLMGWLITLGVGLILAAAYLYQRHKYVGNA